MVINVAKSSVTINVDTKTQVEDFVLLENGFYMLQESGFKIILEQSTLDPIAPSNFSKSSVTINTFPKS